MDVLIGCKRYLGMVKLVLWLHYNSLKVVEFMVELNHKSLEEGEASVSASL